MINKDFFAKRGNNLPQAAIFMSGSGSNAEKLLESVSNSRSQTWLPVVIVTDNPSGSRAREISEKFNIPLVEHDIKIFYRQRGEEKVSLATERGRQLREEWTDQLKEKLSSFIIDFGILAGFVPLTNICTDFPCLNVHPGDLTVEHDGRRLLVGLHTLPIETAILNGFKTLRSSVIIVQPYTGSGGEMDSGPILGISGEVDIDLCGLSLEELKNIHALRPPRRPNGGYKDKLEEIAKLNQENLKRKGDWVVFPPVVADFASGKFRINSSGELFYDIEGEFKKIKTVIYKADGTKIPI